MNSRFWAHSAPDSAAQPSAETGWQPLSAHLLAVSHLSSRLAAAAAPHDANFQKLARLAGAFHDFGKYTAAFQSLIRGSASRCQHAIHGASYLYQVSELPTRLKAALAAAVSGHHAGLPDYSGGAASLTEKLKNQEFREEASRLWNTASQDCPELQALIASLTPSASSPLFPLRDVGVRVLASCLIDADRLDSANKPWLNAPLSASDRLGQLLNHIDQLASPKRVDSLQILRAEILRDCLAAAESAGPLFSLSVPTGGGKTLSSMAFALRRASLYPQRFRRVIIVIPYLSIIEQNASVYSSVFGSEAVLEHHSGSVARLIPHVSTSNETFLPQQDTAEDRWFQSSGLRQEVENWDAPLIVTTSVRFFETLFSNHPRDLRRVHNIARSIVILDEVQTLPRRLLAPLLAMVKELSQDWGVDFVFSTATQPAFERQAGRADPRWEPGTLHEIISNPQLLRSSMVRARLDWRIDGRLSWQQVLDCASGRTQALFIVNLRRHAAELYRELLSSAERLGLGNEAVFHLSTRMAASHRLRRLDDIRERLAANLPCFVVSTQLIEAGVDLDFPLVLRALAPLDSILQAAGRADREGRLTRQAGSPAGHVIIFQPEDDALPPLEYKEATKLTETIAKAALECRTPVQVDSADAMRTYFERYYGEGADLGAALEELRSKSLFASLATQFEMISTRSRDVFVPDDDEARNAIAELSSTRILTSDLRRRLQRHSVGLSPSEFRQAAHVIFPVDPQQEIWIATHPAYQEALGLTFDPVPGALVL